MDIEEQLNQEEKKSLMHMKDMGNAEKKAYRIGYTDGMRLQRKIDKWYITHDESEYSLKVKEKLAQERLARGK